MYTVKEYHYRPAYRRGDLEDEEAVINATSFKTRKAAKDFIESKLKGKTGVYRNYHKGDKRSWCSYYTGKTWTHENTGETCREHFTFELSKA